MTLEEAKSRLDVTGIDPDEVKDRYEELLFQQRQIFLKDPVIPNIIQARIKKNRDLYEAFIVLSNEKTVSDLAAVHLISLEECKYWKELWEGYEENKAILRKQISRVEHIPDLEKSLLLLEKNESDYAHYLISFMAAAKEDWEVKLSESVPVIELIKECENLKAKGLIDDTMVSFQKLSENLFTFNLSKEINRLRKLVKNG